MKTKLKHLSFILMVTLVACVTVNIYFPAAAIQKAADAIVEDVRGIQDDKKEPVPDTKQDKQSFLPLKSWAFKFGPSEAHAQINIEVSTPAIRNLKEAMKNNFAALRPYYGKGAIGENNMGLLEPRNTAGLNLKEKADVTRLMEQENNNRIALYNEIMKANKLGADSLPKIQKIFANSWRDKSEAGWMIQNDNGVWGKK